MPRRAHVQAQYACVLDDDLTRRERSTTRWPVVPPHTSGCTHTSTSSLMRALDPRAPSLLPGWSIGHVLTHLARNADGMRNMIEGAVLGEERLMYPSAEHRDADIEAGSSRTATELVDDVRRCAWALESAWSPPRRPVVGRRRDLTHRPLPDQHGPVAAMARGRGPPR